METTKEASIDNFDYIKESQKTNNVDYPAVLERLNTNGRFLKALSILSNISVLCEDLDVIKKGVMYGNEEKLALVDNEMDVGLFGQHHLDGFQSALDNADGTFVDIFHAIIGQATEVAEQIDAFSQAIADGRPIDLVNLGEEVGDTQWYQSLIAFRLNKTFDQIQLANWKKLQDKALGRYKKGTFTETDATVRDLTAERANLEANLN